MKKTFYAAVGGGLFLLSAWAAASHGETYVSQPVAETLPLHQQLKEKVDIQTDQEQSLIDHQAAVFQIRGRAEILRKSSGEWETLQPEDAIYEGDKIKTGQKSQVDLYFDKFYLNQTRVASDTLAEFFSIEPTQVILTDGNLFNQLDGLPAGSTYEVATPTSVAAVRGTGFLVSFDAKDRSEITAVMTGDVHVFPYMDENQAIDAAKSYDVPETKVLELDHKVFVTAKFEEIEPRPMTEEEKKFLKVNLDRSRIALIRYVGGVKAFGNVIQKWKRLRNDNEKMALIVEALEEHGRDKLKTSAIPFEESLHEEAEELLEEESTSEKKPSEPSEESVVINSAVVGSEEETRRQDTMVGAVETYTGDSNPDEEVNYAFSDDENPFSK